jgi:hypothetical protein
VKKERDKEWADYAHYDRKIAVSAINCSSRVKVKTGSEVQKNRPK